MKNYFTYLQIIVSIFFIVAILLQTPGGGLGRVFGSSQEFYRSKRGMEKLIFYLTIGLAVLFLISSILNLIV